MTCSSLSFPSAVNWELVCCSEGHTFVSCWWVWAILMAIYLSKVMSLWTWCSCIVDNIANLHFFHYFFLLFYNYFLLYEDVDECTSQTHDCPANGVCTNVDGSFQCECQSGLTGDGKTCAGRSRDKLVAYLLSLCLFLNLNLNMVSSATSAMDITQTLKH